MIEWLNDNSGAVQVISVVALVVVTWVYAMAARRQAEASVKQTAASIRMAEEMRQQRLIGVQPVVVPTLLWVQEENIRAFLANVGNGPSFDLSFCLKSLDRAREVDEGTGEQVLKAGDQVHVDFQPQDVFVEKWQPDAGQSVRVFPPGRYTLTASYHDVYANRLLAIRAFELRESHTEGGAKLEVHLESLRFCGYDVQPGREQQDDS